MRRSGERNVIRKQREKVTRENGEKKNSWVLQEKLEISRDLHRWTSIRPRRAHTSTELTISWNWSKSLYRLKLSANIVKLSVIDDTEIMQGKFGAKKTYTARYMLTLYSNISGGNILAPKKQYQRKLLFSINAIMLPVNLTY